MKRLGDIVLAADARNVIQLSHSSRNSDTWATKHEVLLQGMVLVQRYKNSDQEFVDFQARLAGEEVIDDPKKSEYFNRTFRNDEHVCIKGSGGNPTKPGAFGDGIDDRGQSSRPCLYSFSSCQDINESKNRVLSEVSQWEGIVAVFYPPRDVDVIDTKHSTRGQSYSQFIGYGKITRSEQAKETKGDAIRIDE